MDASAPPRLPEPTRLERWVGEGGWFVDLLRPSTDAGVATQAAVLSGVIALLLLPARRLGIVQLWAGVPVFTAGLFVPRGAHQASVQVCQGKHMTASGQSRNEEDS